MATELAGLSPEEYEEWLRREAARRFLLRRTARGAWGFLPYVFPNYVADPVHYFLAERLERFLQDVIEGRSPRLMVFVPPQHGKSELCSRKFPAWALGNHPDLRFILASYGADLAEELSGDARATVMSDAYAELFGRTATEDTGEAVEIEKSRKSLASWKIARRRGGLRAVGVGGAITGQSADILIIDDPVKGRKEAESESYRQDAKSWWPQARDRVQKGGGIIILMTRWHHDDLAGYLLKLAREKPEADQWEVINLPAIAEGEGDPLGRKPGEALAPSRYDLAELATLRAVIGSYEWNAKFMGRPTPSEGGIIKLPWFVRADPRVNEQPLATYQFWDTAFTKRKRSDRSVGGTWRIYRSCFRLEDVFYGRLTVPELKREMGRLYGLYRPRAVYIETEKTGTILLQEWHRETRLPFLGYNPQKDGDKVARAYAVQPLLESGRVEIPKDAPWIEEFLDECKQFPEGEHDDMVDMLTMSLIVMGVKDARARGRLIQRPFRVEK